MDIPYLMETPYIAADLRKIKANILHMQEIANQNHCKLRPHIKTHKSVEIARMQIQAGAEGITCAKISEAEVMADGGIDDIFIAYPLWGESKIDRAIRLRKRIKRLILGVDSYACAEQLSRRAAESNITLELRLEVDTGALRTGISASEAVSLAKQIAALDRVELTGLYTFKGLIFGGNPSLNTQSAGHEECVILDKIRRQLADEGLMLREISTGSTPTAAACAQTGLTDEIRPGTYVFHDQMTYMAGACRYEDIAAAIYTTVVSTPSPAYAVLDGGSKVFPTDVLLGRSPFSFYSYAYVPGNDNLRLDRLSEEHGIITAKDGITGLQAGERLTLVPIHICTAVNLRDYIYLYDGENIRKLTIDARGMSV